MAIKWTKQDVVNRIQMAMNEAENPQPPAQQPRQIISNLLEKARQNKQGQIPPAEM